MAFLEVITRCFQRPRMLAYNQESLQSQTCDDWIQTLLVDEIGRGVGWSYQQMALYADDLEGDYIWILDDDDMCIRMTLVDELKQIATIHNPDVIMIKMNHLTRGILPDELVWKRKPVIAHIGVSAFVVKRELWQRHAGAFLSADYSADFDFISSIFQEEGVGVFWHDVIASQVQKISLGLPELVI